MKKLTAILLAAVLLVSAATVTAFAASGPSDVHWGEYYFAFVSLYDAKDDFGDSYGIFRNNETHNDLLEGATYDRDANTLTLSSFNHPELALSTNMMGDDFKLKIVGECALAQIVVWGDGYGGSLHIIGDGDLTVKSVRPQKNAIELRAEASDATLTFGKDVTVRLYSDYYAVYTSDTTVDDAAKGIVFENGESYPVEFGELLDSRPDTLLCYEAQEGQYMRNLGVKLIKDDDPNGIYSGYYEEENDTYTIQHFVYFEDFDALVPDYSTRELYLKEEELAENGFTIVMENSPKTIYCADKWDEEHHRGIEGDKLECSNDPTGVYVANYSWVTDREHPTHIYISRLEWDDALEFYVVDTSYEGLIYDPEDFAVSPFSYQYEGDSRATVRYIPEYWDYRDYASERPMVLNDNRPDKVYIAYNTYADEEMTELIGYSLQEVHYNEARGYYLIDEDTWQPVSLAEFENDGYYYTYEDKPAKNIWEYTCDLEFTEMEISRDANGTRYATNRYMQTVYDIYESDTLDAFGETYTRVAQNEEVDFSDLTTPTHDVPTGYYYFKIGDATFVYNDGDAPAITLGDVDGNGKIDIDDATAIQKYLAEIIELDADQLKAADVNHDNKIDIDDVTTIQKYLAEMIDRF